VVTDRPFTHPHFGNEARVEQHGREVRIIFVASREEQASDLTDLILDQLRAGGLNLTMMGKPTKVTEQ
jgi:hypothetical protein